MARLKWLWLTVAFLVPVSAQAQCDPAVNGPFSLSAQEPGSCAKYPNSVWRQPLPSDKLSHLATGSDTLIAAMALTISNWVAQFPTPGTADYASVPVAYGQATDPMWKFDTICGPCGVMGTSSYVKGTFWRIPDGTKFTNQTGSNDEFLSVYDQTTDRILQVYSSGAVVTLTGCAGTDEASACEWPIAFSSATQQLRTATGADTYRLPYSGGNSLHDAPHALLIRNAELIAGEIRHALYLNIDCENTGNVFPALDTGSGQARQCVDWAPPTHDALAAQRPYHGALIFCDYSDGDIAAMSISDFQKIILRALCKYGGYIGDTSETTIIQVQREESLQAWYDALSYPFNESLVTVRANIPIFDWFQDQVDAAQPGISRAADGTTLAKFTVDLFSISGFASHLHVADECVAKGLAGVVGGCATPTNPDSGAVFTLLCHGIAKSVDMNNVTSAACNTTGANLITLSVSTYAAGAITLVDSESNTYDCLTPHNGTIALHKLCHKENPATGAAHTIGITGTGIYPCIAWQVWAVTPANFRLDAQSGTTLASGTTIQPGSLTPAGLDSLWVTGVTVGDLIGSSVSIDSSFVVSDKIDDWTCGMAYKIRSTIAAENPTWTSTATLEMAAGMADFVNMPGSLPPILAGEYRRRR